MRAAHGIGLAGFLFLGIIASCQHQGEISNTKVPQALETALAKKDVKEALRVIQGMPSLGDDIYVALERSASSEDPARASVAITVLGRIPNKGQLRIMEDVARDSSGEMLRCQAMYCMGVLRDPAAVPYLLGVLGSQTKTDYERTTAVRSLRHIRKGFVDELPMWVGNYVLIGKPHEGLSDLPTLDEQYAEYTEWWNANSKQLLSERQVRDYRGQESHAR
jgi:hypothetical protein